MLAEYGITWERVLAVAELPARILFLLVLGFVVRRLLFRAIDRLTRTAAATALQRNGATPARQIPVRQARQSQRAMALGSLFKSTVTGVIGLVVVAMILSLLGFNLGPFLASAGIAGVALGFGAQNMVKDLVSGVFMLLEDQFGVGDYIDMGEATGTVEAVGLRITRLRDFNGTLWSVRNGEVLRVGNQSMGWAAISVDIEIAYDENVGTVLELLERVGREFAADSEWHDSIIDPPKPLGVKLVSQWAVTIAMLGKCDTSTRFSAPRELRQRIKAGLDAEGIRRPEYPITFPPQTTT